MLNLRRLSILSCYLMLRLPFWLFVLLLVCPCIAEVTITYDDRVDAAYDHAGDYKNYYLSDGANELYIGTYRQAPVLHKFDAACLIECGNRGNELFLVSAADGSLKLTNLIPQVYELYPASKAFALFVDEVRRESNGRILIRLYSPTEDGVLVVYLDENLTLVASDI